MCGYLNVVWKVTGRERENPACVTRVKRGERERYGVCVCYLLWVPTFGYHEKRVVVFYLKLRRRET